MPKIKEEIQLPSLENVIKPKEGISLYNNNGKLKILHSNGTSETVYTGTGGGGSGSGANIDDDNASTSTTYSSSKIDSTYAKKTEIPSLTGYARTEYVDTKVSELVNSAPETLDTLKELSDALGGDANFATTVATQIGNKQDKLTAGNGITIINNVISSTATGPSSSVTFRTWEA